MEINDNYWNAELTKTHSFRLFFGDFGDFTHWDLTSITNFHHYLFVLDGAQGLMVKRLIIFFLKFLNIFCAPNINRNFLREKWSE